MPWIAEYLRALVLTNSLAEYLPDEDSGKPSRLHTLFQELKQRVSGTEDESGVRLGVSEKKPLHVVLVDPKVSNKSRSAQELLASMLFTITVGIIWVMGAVALHKFLGSFGGVGNSGVSSSTSYAPKEVNKDVMPEKNVKTFKDVKGCDDAKQELEEVVEYLRNPSKFTRLGGKLPKHEKALHALANALLEYETLNAEEIRRILHPYQEGGLPEQQEQEATEGELVLV